MKYFTKEWYRDTLVAQMCFQIRKDAKAAKHSDKYFNSLYSAQKSWFVKHLKRAAKHTHTPFDVSAAEKEFEANYQENLDFVTGSLPSEILERVADVRILALGCAEQNLLLEITRYCGQVNRKCEKICEDYDAEVEKLADKTGWLKINSLNMLSNAPIRSIDVSAVNRWVIETSPEVTEIACRLTLIEPVLDEGSFHALNGATILYFELLPAESDDKMTFSLLCESKSSELIELSFTVADLEAEEIK
ncbi:MAG: hypothetical protein IJY39_03220 [Clostridia bacterium]|nr:hypothetical protein [Clostridia bacterium]